MTDTDAILFGMNMYDDGYNQALEDFIKTYKEKSSMENKLVDDIAEQLKR